MMRVMQPRRNARAAHRRERRARRGDRRAWPSAARGSCSAAAARTRSRRWRSSWAPRRSRATSPTALRWSASPTRPATSTCWSPTPACRARARCRDRSGRDRPVLEVNLRAPIALARLAPGMVERAGGHSCSSPRSPARSLRRRELDLHATKSHVLRAQMKRKGVGVSLVTPGRAGRGCSRAAASPPDRHLNAGGRRQGGRARDRAQRGRDRRRLAGLRAIEARPRASRASQLGTLRECSTGVPTANRREVAAMEYARAATPFPAPAR